MRRVQKIKFSITRLLTLVFCLAITSVGFAGQPNIVLIVADDHGTDALGCYGNSVIQTPTLDRLANEGVRFTNAYCTSASCAASRSVILTGLYSHATGSYGHVHDYHHFSTYENVKSLPTLLAQAGYVTARVGKYHLAPEKVYRFDRVLKADPRSTAEMAKACTETIESDQPFFLYFCPDDPHRGHPFTPKPWNAANSFGNRSQGYPEINPIKYDPATVIVPPFLPDTRECREEIAQYYQSISRIDQGVKQLLQIIDTAGKTDRTIVIYLSDNGMAFPGAKTTAYEPGIKLPCIVKDPNAKLKGVVNQAMINWTDLTPTILDFAGVKFAPKEFHGRSFKSVLEVEKPKDWQKVYAAHNFHELTMYYPMRVIREGDMKLIWNIAWRLKYPFASDLWASSTWQSVHRSKLVDSKKYFGKRTVKDYLFRAEFELYDLASDPDELNNLADDKAHAEQLNRLKKSLKQFQLDTKDPWQIMWGHETEVQGTGVDL